MYLEKKSMSANRAQTWQTVRAREQKCVPRSTGMGIKKGLYTTYSALSFLTFYNPLHLFPSPSPLFFIIFSLSPSLLPLPPFSSHPIPRGLVYNTKWRWITNPLIALAHDKTDRLTSRKERWPLLEPGGGMAGGRRCRLTDNQALNGRHVSIDMDLARRDLSRYAYIACVG